MKPKWKYCVIGNIVKTHMDGDVLRYGTRTFSGGAKVYLCGKYWDEAQKTITVIGLSRGKRFQIDDIPVTLIENIRFHRVYNPTVLEIMNNWEFEDLWWHDTEEDKQSAEAFVQKWMAVFPTINPAFLCNDDTTSSGDENMELELTSNAKSLYDLLFTKSFDSQALIAKLSSGACSTEEINFAAYRYVSDCIHLLDYDDSRIKQADFGESIPGLESSHFLEAIGILLDFGLDPNYVVNDFCEDNIMFASAFVLNGYQSADAAALMLEHGGNPNLVVANESLISHLDFELLWFLRGDVESRYLADIIAHYWMVFVGYGAKWDDSSDIVVTYDDFKTSGFRNHRQYYYGFVHAPNGHSVISFFDKSTNREIARLE